MDTPLPWISECMLKGSSFLPDSPLSLEFIDAALSNIRNKQNEVMTDIKSYLSTHRSTLQQEAQNSVEFESSVHRIKQKIQTIRTDILDPEVGIRSKCCAALDQHALSSEKEKTLLHIQKYLKRAEKIEKSITQGQLFKGNEQYKEAAESLSFALRTAQKGAEKYPFLLIYRHATKSLQEKLQQFSRTCLTLLPSSLVLNTNELYYGSSLNLCQSLLEAYYIAQGDLEALVQKYTPDLLDHAWRFEQNKLTKMSSETTSESKENNAVEFYHFLHALLPSSIRKPLGAAFHEYLRHTYLSKLYLPRLPSDLLTPFLEQIRKFDAVDAKAIELFSLDSPIGSLAEAMDFQALMQQKRMDDALNMARKLWFSSNLNEVTYTPASWSLDSDAGASTGEEASSAFTLLDPSMVQRHPLPMHPQTISATMAEFLTLLQQHDPVPLIQFYTMYLHLFPTMVPRIAMLHFVDAMVLIDWCTHRFILQPRPSLTIAIPPLMETAKKLYQQQLTHQKGLFFECFQPALLEMRHIEERGIEKVQLYLQRIQSLIKQIRSAIGDILPPPLFYHFLGTLLDAVLTALLTELLSWEDITVNESELLYTCWKPFLASITLPKEFIPSFTSLNALVETLTSSLKDIQSRLRQHQYTHCSAQHLEHFILALFQESDLRKSVIKEVKEGVQRGLIQT